MLEKNTPYLCPKDMMDIIPLSTCNYVIPRGALAEMHFLKECSLIPLEKAISRDSKLSVPVGEVG